MDIWLAYADFLPQLFLAWSIQLVGVFSPGPAVMLIVGVAVSRGRMEAILTAFGVACGATVLSLGTVLGMTAILAATASLMDAMRIAGAVYLVWQAWRSFRSALAGNALNIKPAGSESGARNAMNGFFLQLTNPKAIFFWLAIASVGGAGEAPWPVLALFVAGAFLNSFLGHGAYALALSSGPVRKAYIKIRRPADLVFGGFFLFAAYRLLGRS